MHISDWSSDVCSSDLFGHEQVAGRCAHEHLYACRARQHFKLAQVARVGVGRPDIKGVLAPHAARRALQLVGERIGSVGIGLGVRHFKDAGDSAKHGSRSEEHTSELQSLMRISYAVFCLKKKKTQQNKMTRNKIQT